MKNKFNEKLVLIMIIVFLLIISILFFIIKFNNINSEVIDNSLFLEEFFSEDNCRCFERERLKCDEEFEFDEERRLCKKGNEVTNVLLGCSKYECSGQVYSFNFNTKEWETK
tara:strand:- start:2194 stop:2529 length:336 start_codon:yes stop_codon:yes gene_type:complete